jgi:hypothetical protein
VHESMVASCFYCRVVESSLDDQRLKPSNPKRDSKKVSLLAASIGDEVEDLAGKKGSSNSSKRKRRRRSKKIE